MNQKTKPVLDFEKPLVEIEEEIEAFKRLAAQSGVPLGEDIARLTGRVQAARELVYRQLGPEQRVQIARHPSRPTALDHIANICDDFVELHGDRQGFDDSAIVGGLARLDGRTVVIVANQKGRDTKDNIKRNFGMAHPEGYRKALRLFGHAAKFGFPLVTLVDTPGAYPGIEAERRGQSSAIAKNLLAMSRLPVPIITAIIGEGSSGGAIGIGVSDRTLICEHAYYAVISPEGCAAILWKDGSKAKLAAEAMKMTAQDLLSLGLVDEIVPEPLGGAHRDPLAAAGLLERALKRNLSELTRQSTISLLESRAAKYRGIGKFREVF